MSDLVYTRVSTDEQSTLRQTHLLAEAGLTAGAEGVRMFSDPATSSKIPALTRAGFTELAGYTRPGDTLTVSELYRLCRDLADILAVRGWCQQHGVKLRVLSGPLSTITDLAATDATTTMLVNIVVSVGQFQRDLQNELTREGLAAAWAQGARSGRRPQVAKLGAVDDVRTAFRDGTSIAALAREHGVSRGAIRTAVADLLPDQPQRPVAATVTAPEAVLVEIPGKIAQYLAEHDDLGEQEQRALRKGRTVRRGQGYSLHVTATPEIHQALLAAAATLGAEGASSADRKAYRIYFDRLNAAATIAATPAAAVRNIGTESSATPPDTEIRRPKPARLTGPGSEVSPELVARLEKQRVAMAASRCPTCGNEPVEARARWQQRQDLAIVWLYADPDRPGAVIEKHHCMQCQPHQHFATIVCPLCGDGPMVAGDLADLMPDEKNPPELVRGWLTEQGWHDDPDDGLVCAEHRPVSS